MITVYSVFETGYIKKLMHEGEILVNAGFLKSPPPLPTQKGLKGTFGKKMGEGKKNKSHCAKITAFYGISLYDTNSFR